MAIPQNITKEHIMKAIEEIDKNGVPDERQQRKYHLKYKGRNYNTPIRKPLSEIVLEGRFKY
jgi:hypothetical protein